jgi:hypothetical protein
MTAPVLDRPGVRVLPVPAYDPPFDDEHHSPHWASLPAPPLFDMPTTGTRRTAAHPTTPPAPPDTGNAAGPSASTRAAAHRFMTTCLEVLNGYRPVAHLRGLSHPLAAAKILDAVTRATRRASRSGCEQRSRVDLRRMRICEPRPGVAEASAVLRTRGHSGTHGSGVNDRCWAVAFRLEQRHGRWQCHVVEVV